MHARQCASASAAAPLDGPTAVRPTSTQPGPSIHSAKAERNRTLHVALRRVLDTHRKRGDAAASAGAIARKLGIHQSVVAESLNGSRTLTAERALLDTPLLVAEEFVDEVLGPRRSERGDPYAVRALLLAIERIACAHGDAADEAVADAIEQLQRIKRERRTP